MVHGRLAVSGWFGLCSVGGQAPLQIKDSSVKVPDSACGIYMCVSVCVCARLGRGVPGLLPLEMFFFSLLLTIH